MILLHLHELRLGWYVVVVFGWNFNYTYLKENLLL